MTHDARTDHVSSWHRKLLVAATVMTALLIFMGGVVCVTQSGRACPYWPRCNGQLGPPMRLDAIIEYSHRLVAALTSPFILGAAVVGWMRTRSLRWVSWPPMADKSEAFYRSACEYFSFAKQPSFENRLASK